MPKLKIRIFGVCLATPLSDETEPKTIEKITVLTPQSPRSKLASDDTTQIDALYTYLIVSRANAPDSKSVDAPDSKSGNPSEPPLRKPDHRLGENEKVCAFMLHREEITLSVDSRDGVRLPYGEAGFPEKPTTASKDPRWICNLPSLLNGSSVRTDCLNPVGNSIPHVVGTRLVAHCGEFTGEFPCGDKGKTKMHHMDLERYFAQEMALTVDLPDGEVLLQSRPFDGGGTISPILLRTAGGNDFEIFLVCAPLVTMDDLSKSDLSKAAGPCAVTNDHHHDADVDFEFEVLWDLLNLPRGVEKPVPGLTKKEGSRIDCIPGGG